MQLAMKLGAVPRDGVHSIGRGLKMDLRFDQFADQLVYYDAVEPGVFRTMLGRLRPGDVFVDIGANIGYYTLWASQIVGPTGRVLSFEPQPDIFARMSANVRMNGLTNVTPHGFALGEQLGELTLYIPDNSLGFGHASMSPQDWQNPTSVRVPVKRLDDVLSGCPRIDLIKIDAEGAELSILKGARRTIAAHQPTVVAELNPGTATYFGYHPLELVDLLLDYHPGYQFLHITPHAARAVTASEMRRNNLDSGDLLAWEPRRGVTASQQRAAA
jgi:FkbM family methyltransferase